MTLVQIGNRTGQVRGPSEVYSAPPSDGSIELHLGPHERVIQVAWRRGIEMRSRKTVDWYWTATVETRLP
jgi:hypothetical protein